MKIYQILGTSIAIPGCSILEALNALPPGAILSASYIGLTGSALLSLVSLPFRNTIGFLYVSKNNEKVKISSMDFWGRRRDKTIPVDDWIPLLELSPKKMDPLYLTPQIADGSKYKLFIKFGNIMNQTKMSLVLE
ncbi:unnamed protein product [Arctia plantaginis]|uniref:Transmembrane protein 186 n=1 Tax=Arctia plantaginis TaxID=874455 RepID=A0A8S0YYF6_ARCPL|nr:unnamed protein product [Arctia plantaginis]